MIEGELFMTKKRAVLLVLFLVALVSGSGLANYSANFAIPWDVMSSGGNRMTSANYSSESTMSQNAIGLSSSSSFQMGAGYWYGTELNSPGYDIYLPMVR